MSVKALQDFTFTSKYSRYQPENKRRETYKEAVQRSRQMMLDKYFDKPEVHKYIEQAYLAVENKKVIGSQRALQFAGKPALKKAARIYNCASSQIDRLRFFQECMYLLLCGCGTGFSVQKHHIAKLPKLVSKKSGKKKFVIPDSIEGWSDAVGILVGSYFEDSLWDEYTGKEIEFDYSQIRPAGSYLSSSSGKAPGPEKLKRSLEHIRVLLDKCLVNQKFRTIDAYDIVMHCANAVVSGGVRRCIAEGQKVTLKNGSFKNIENIIIGDEVLTEGGWKKVKNTFKQGKQKTIKIKHSQGEMICTPNHKIAVLCNIFGEFIWKRADELTLDDKLFYCRPKSLHGINKLPEFTYIKPLHSTTCKDIIIPELDSDIAWFIGAFQGDGYVYLTESAGYLSVAVHKDDIEQMELVKECFERFGVNVSVQQPTEKDGCFKVKCKSKQLATYFHTHIKQPKTTIKVPDFIKNATGDIRAAYLKGVMDSDGSIKTRPQQIVVSVYKDWVNELQNLLYSIGIVTYTKTHKVKNNNWQTKYSVIITNNDDIEIFNNIGKPYFKNPVVRKFNKSQNKYTKEMVGHIEDWNLRRSGNYTTIVTNKLGGNKNVVPIKINSIENYDIKETYDIEVEDNHSFICEGILVHNSATIALFSQDDEDMLSAKTGDWFYTNPQRGRSNNSVVLLRNSTSYEEFKKIVQRTKEFGEPGFVWVDNLEFCANPCLEIGFWPYLIVDEDKFRKFEEDNAGYTKIDAIPSTIGLASGWQMCNLSSLNCKKIKTEEDFYEACENAAIIGTLQAGFNQFPYLGDVSSKIVQREALLGVSMTGMMESPDICLNPDVQKNGAKIVKKINKKIAALIDINPAARTTCVKPEGSSSCMLGTSSGIHPHHAKRYIRRVQTNRLDNVYQHFKKYNEIACEQSAWSENKTDDVIAFCIEIPDGAKTKNQLSAIQLLEQVKSTQQNWVMSGINKELCTQSWLSHNVSNTVNVKPEEWDDVIKFIYDNRKYLCGVSLLSITGDKDYQQAPFTAIYLPSEISKYYGDGSLFVSGLIDKALELFEDNLWLACDTALGVKHADGKAKSKWVERCKKFADRYFSGDLKKLTYCMKDVYNWKLWLDLNREYKDVDYTTLVEEQDNTNMTGESACAGGKCEF